MTKKFRSESERKRIAIQKGEEMYPMTDQPAVPEEKPPVCPKCGTEVEWVVPPIPGAHPFFQCQDGDCNWIQDDESPSPSVGELWPDTVVGFIRKELTSVKSRDNRAFYFEELNPKYQQALLRKGGLDREKTLAILHRMDRYLELRYFKSGEWRDCGCVNEMAKCDWHRDLSAIESGKLDVTPDNEGKGGGK